MKALPWHSKYVKAGIMVIMHISLSFIMILNMTGCIDGLLRDAVPAATLQMRSSLQASMLNKRKG